MKHAFAIVLIVAAAVQSSAIRAQGDPAARYGHWEHHLRDRVNQELAYPIGGAPGASGDVFVAFRIGPDGKPADISVQRSSGNAMFDRAAVSLISRLGRLGAIPSADGTLARVVLKLSYGDGAQTVSEAVQVARADRQEQLANERRNRALVSVATRVADNH
jgi:TonB family protein